ncbi:related to iron transport protein [Fusarium torulosum]|uniref:Related to iron transport protein n=1 Tax=Fusarium torulosum TaxID=33205 RepID=A0AAE8MAQ4_9HYPO|nr:related to iron transport protein [Fusarium torulosum]
MARIHCAHAQSTVASFIQLARRSYATKAAQASAPLEFLIPRCIPPFGLRAPQLYVTHSRAYVDPRRSLDSRSHEIATRQFSTSAVRQKTRAILNPQQDEDGNEMLLEITDRAAKRLNKIMDKDGNPNLALRIQVESGGCHGFQYLMSLITLPAKDTAEWSSVINEDDTIFQYIPDDADPAIASEEGPKIILDEPSLDLLKGSKVDFTMELIGSQFKIVDNPLATSSCGCGTSFDIKM